MTRREELDERARDYVSLFVMSGVEPEATRNLSWLLQEVERECWAANEKAARDAAFLMGNDKWKERNVLLAHADWCRAQQKELE